MFNDITIVGRLTTEPTLRYTPNGHAICNFTLAVDRPRKDAEGNKVTDFFFVETWRKLAENCANYLDKGKLALVNGEAHIEKWEKDGEKHQMFKIAANMVRFLSPNTSNTSSGSQGGVSSLGHEVNLDDDIPF